MRVSKKIILVMLMIIMFITFNSFGLIIPVMPIYLQTFGAAGQVLGFIIALFAFGQFLFSPLAGSLSDRYGRKKLIIFGLLVNGLSQILFGLATETWMLFLFRFITGFGTAFIIPPVMAYAADLTTNEERGKAMGWLGASISLGFMIGPGFGGLLSNITLRFPFYFGGFATIVVGLIALFILPQIKPTIMKDTKRENLLQQMARSVKASYFVLLIVVFVFQFGIANFQSTLSMFLTYRWDYTPTNIAIVMTVGAAVGVIIQAFVIDALFRLIGEMKIILASLLVAALSLYGMLYVSGFFLILLTATIFSTATTLIRPAVNTLISKTAGQEQGYAAGMNNAYMSLGNMIGPALAGTLFDWHMNIPFTFGAVILLGCFFLTFSWSRITTAEQKSAS